MQLSAQQWWADRDQRSSKRFEAERRVAQVDALRAAAKDLRTVGQLDSTQTVEWLDHRADRIEHPEPPKPLTPVQFAAWTIAMLLMFALLLVVMLNGGFHYVQPL